MEKSDIQKLRELPIEGVAERLGLKVVKHKALCPFHNDSNPSLSFSVSRNTYKCFVCGTYGGVIDLAMKLLGKGFIDTCQWLADENNIILEKYQPVVKEIKHYPPDVDFLAGLVSRPVLNEAACQFLFEKRKLNPKVIEWCGISSISHPTPCWRYGKPFYDSPSLLFPYKDINGKVLNVQSRYLGNESGIARFRFPSNSSIHVFNLPILRYLKSGEPLFISEGITDCLALLSAGHKAIAIPSATLLKPEDVTIITHNLAPDTQMHIYPDNDAAGESVYRKLAGITATLGVCLIRHDLPSGSKDFSDYYLTQHS